MVLAASLESHPKLLLSPRFSVAGSSEPINLQPSQLPLIAEVKSKLLDGAYELESSPCACGAATGVAISEVDRYGLPLTFVLCTACGTIRIDPYLDTASLEDFYTRWFGAAASPMKTYYDALEPAFANTTVHGHEDVVLNSIYTPELLAKLGRAMQ